MPRIIATTDKRNWLKESEDGKEIAAIARESKRDTRTIKKGIDDARRERDAGRAISEILVRSLRKHHDSLLVLAERLMLIFKSEPLNGYLIWKGTESSFKIPGGNVKYELWPKPKVLKIELDEESKPEWELLTEHLRRDPLIIGIRQWKNMLTVNIQARILLSQKLAQTLADNTGCRILDKSYSPPEEKPRPPFIDPYTVNILSDIMFKKLTNDYSDKMLDNITADESTGEITLGKSGPLLALAPGRASVCKDKIISTYNELLTSDEARYVSATHHDLIETAKKVTFAAQEILLLDFIPGHCRICHKIGL